MFYNRYFKVNSRIEKEIKHKINTKNEEKSHSSPNLQTHLLVSTGSNESNPSNHSNANINEESLPRKHSLQGDIFFPELPESGSLESSDESHSQTTSIRPMPSTSTPKNDIKICPDSPTSRAIENRRTEVNQRILDIGALDFNDDEIISQSDEQRLLESSNELLICAEINISKKRFWILFIFSMFSFFTSLQWNAWGPISESIIATFPDWTYGTVAWMESLTTGVIVIALLPICWATHKFGLRIGMIFSTAILAVGLCLRCITDTSPIFTIMCHISSTLLGLSTTLILASPPFVASEWFPPTERTSATAFIMAADQLGSVGSYLEPLIVHEPGDDIPNSLIKSDIMFIMYIAAAVGVSFCILVLIYFPSKPPMPPSVSSSTDRLEFKQGLTTLLTDPNLLKLVLIYGIVSGPSLGWLGMLNYSLKPLGYSQNESMFIGIVSVVMCFFFSVAIGWLTDQLYGFMRETIIVLLILSALSYYWFLLISHHVIDTVDWQVYTSVSIGMALQYSTVPLFYELAAEMTYPVHEVLVGGFVTAADSFFTSLFLFMFLIKDIGFEWVTYVLVGSVSIPVLGLLFVEEGYRKTKLDRRTIVNLP